MSGFLIPNVAVNQSLDSLPTDSQACPLFLTAALTKRSLVQVILYPLHYYVIMYTIKYVFDLI